jgi:CheY-like chemotaxis protein
LPETILVVEDEVIVRMVVADYLRHCGYKVIEACNADEAITVLQQAEVKVDVLFSDVEMPGALDGFALSTWVRANRPEIEVILASSAQRTIKSAEELCEGGTLPKPYDRQAVVDRIKRLRAKREARRS